MSCFCCPEPTAIVSGDDEQNIDISSPNGIESHVGIMGNEDPSLSEAKATYQSVKPIEQKSISKTNLKRSESDIESFYNLLMNDKRAVFIMYDNTLKQFIYKYAENALRVYNVDKNDERYTFICILHSGGPQKIQPFKFKNNNGIQALNKLSSPNDTLDVSNEILHAITQLMKAQTVSTICFFPNLRIESNDYQIYYARHNKSIIRMPDHFVNELSSIEGLCIVPKTSAVLKAMDNLESNDVRPISILKKIEEASKKLKGSGKDFTSDTRYLMAKRKSIAD